MQPQQAVQIASNIEPNDSLYWYQAVVSGVYDGDTITASIDLGLDIGLYNQKLRLARINAPELPTLEGEASRDFLSSWVNGKDIIIQTKKDGKEKYGRYLAEVWVEVDGKWINMNSLMLEKGFANVY